MKNLPKSVLFSFKFYSFDAMQTEPAQLSTIKSIEEGKAETGEVGLGKKYYLVMEDQLRFFSTTKPAFE